MINKLLDAQFFLASGQKIEFAQSAEDMARYIFDGIGSNLDAIKAKENTQQ